MNKHLLTLIALPLLAAHAQALNIQRWHTTNGTQVLLVERHDNPIVDIRVSFKGAGKAFDTAHHGQAAAFAAAMLTDGTKQLNEEAYKARTNDLAINLSSNSSDGAATINLRSLSRPSTLNPAIALLNQSITEPRFDHQVFQRHQQQSITALQQNETNPNFLAERALTRLNYPTHPYGNSAQVSPQSLQQLTLNDIRSFYRSHYSKNNAIVAIVGNLNRQQANKIVQQSLKGLPTHSQATSKLPIVPTHSAQQQHIPFQSEQTQILLGMPLITRSDPDYFPLVIGNYILGAGGFDSRLMKVLRDQYGYTYGVSSSLAPTDQAGAFTISLASKKASAQAALQATQKVVRDFIQQGPTEAELQQAKNNIIGSFPLRFDTNAKLLSYISMIGYYNLPSSYLEDYPKAVANVTTEQIKNTWQRRVNPENLNIITVGNL